MNAVESSSLYIRGLRRGYRLAGRSLARRLAVSLLLSAVLLGASIGLLLEAGDIFARLATGDSAATIITLGKNAVWNRLFTRR